MNITRLYMMATVALVVPQGMVRGQSALTDRFTYQGQLKQGGLPLSGTCDFEFSLWDNAFGGSQVGTTQTRSGVSVTNGLFSVQVGFGVGAFDGNARWLEVAVRCPAGNGTFTPLTPRQELTPAPHALALPGLRTEWIISSPPGTPNLIGGHHDNTVISGVTGATIGGGGTVDPFFGVVGTLTNRVTDDFGTVGGGGGNQAGDDAGDVGDARYTTVGGGRENTASGFYAVVGGGLANETTGDAATIAGGDDNAARGVWATVGGGSTNVADGHVAAIAGGFGNRVTGEYGAIAGGGASEPFDTATANRVLDDYGAVGGGGNNQAGSDDDDTTTAIYATVGGGIGNTASGANSTIGGGDENSATQRWATVGGGTSNSANGEGATVGGGGGVFATDFWATACGGNSNRASASFSSVGGGAGNIASGQYATVPGGQSNTAAGDYSCAAGRRAKANHNGSFVWADQIDADFASTAPDQFLIRAAGGVGIGTDSPVEHLHVAGNARTDGTLFVEGNIGVGPISPTERLTVLGNIDASGNLKAGGDVQVGETVVNSAMPVSAEQSTTSTSFVQLATFDIPDQNADRLMTLNIRFRAKGASPGQTAVFIVRGFCYGDGSATDLPDHYNIAPLLGTIHVRSSVYNDYHLNLGPFAISDDQRWRFVVFYRTRNATYAASVNELEWEARSIRYEY